MVEKLALLKSHRNRVFHLLQEGKVNPANFQWDQSSGKARLKHNTEGFYFSVGRDRDGDFEVEFWPDEDGRVLEETQSDWESVLDNVRTWVSALSVELDEPDLWITAGQYSASFGFGDFSETSNEPFSDTEGEHISKALTELRRTIEKEFSPGKKQQEEIARRLSYLEDASKRQGRLDWVHTAIGVFVSIAMGLGLSSTDAARLWQLVKSTFVVSAKFLVSN